MVKREKMSCPEYSPWECLDESDSVDECEAYGHAPDGPDMNGVMSCFCGLVKYPNGIQKAKMRLDNELSQQKMP